ncbi:hypothetical protein FHT21_001477 [Pedobacter sp. SG908]|nr:hypothetical protein [Pedobacter sp. SG908]NMN36458.1 hypothetical protein [Pedobacter sp. SG918]
MLTIAKHLFIKNTACIFDDTVQKKNKLSNLKESNVP